MEMHVGDKVPADIRIIALKTATLRSEQASLTGESVAVLKGTEAVQEDGCELQVRLCYWGACVLIAFATFVWAQLICPRLPRTTAASCRSALSQCCEFALESQVCAWHECLGLCERRGSCMLGCGRRVLLAAGGICHYLIDPGLAAGSLAARGGRCHGIACNGLGPGKRDSSNSNWQMVLSCDGLVQQHSRVAVAASLRGPPAVIQSLREQQIG